MLYNRNSTIKTIFMIKKTVCPCKLVIHIAAQWISPPSIVTDNTGFLSVGSWVGTGQGRVPMNWTLFVSECSQLQST